MKTVVALVYLLAIVATPISSRHTEIVLHPPLKRTLLNTDHLCAQPPVGSLVLPPPELVSMDSRLKIELSFQSTLDKNGNPKFCYVLPTGEQSPLLRVQPGDKLLFRLRNDAGIDDTTRNPRKVTCRNMPVPLQDATNVHFHGLAVSPMCPSDNVLHVTINPGDTFLYKVNIPDSAAPGLYWYHPHVHGSAEEQVKGGASGAIIIEGIENMQPHVSGLAEQVLVVRDHPPAANFADDPDAPAWDVSVNNIPILFASNTSYEPALLNAKPGERLFCRLVNAAAGTILDIALVSDSKLQQIGLVALDGYVLRDGDKPLVRDVHHVLIGTASRAEFIIKIPEDVAQDTTLVTRHVNTGEDGDNNPYRPLVKFNVFTDVTHQGRFMPAATHVQALPYVTSTNHVTKTRTLYFSEKNQERKFYITEVGATPTLFAANNPPAIVVHQGAVEDWIIENRSQETHVFHLHQLHFTLLEHNGKYVQKNERQELDTVNVGFWNNNGPYPSIKVRIDFRGADIGKFVYHCHILEHEDHGMMAIIKVVKQQF